MKNKAVTDAKKRFKKMEKIRILLSQSIKIMNIQNR